MGEGAGPGCRSRGGVGGGGGSGERRRLPASRPPPPPPPSRTSSPPGRPRCPQRPPARHRRPRAREEPPEPGELDPRVLPRGSWREVEALPPSASPPPPPPPHLPRLPARRGRVGVERAAEDPARAGEPPEAGSCGGRWSPQSRGRRARGGPRAGRSRREGLRMPVREAGGREVAAASGAEQCGPPSARGCGDPGRRGRAAHAWH